MGKMKELAYTVERIELLFRYLDLLNELNHFYAVNDRVMDVCNEIEKELGIRCKPENKRYTIEEIYNSAVKVNGEALERLSKE